MASEIYAVELKFKQHFIVPHVCYCCLKETSRTEEITYTPNFQAVWITTYSMNFYLCDECERHKRKIGKERALFWLGIIAAIWAGIMLAACKMSYLLPLPIMALLFFVYRLLLLNVTIKNLTSKGHAAHLPEITMKIHPNKKILFYFQNKRFAEIFDELNG